MALPRTLISGLSSTQLTALRPTGKSFDVADPAVPGLLLRIGPKGTKRWLLRFKWRAERTRIALGDFPEIGLARARELAIGHRSEILRGIDPRRSSRNVATPVWYAQVSSACPSNSGPWSTVIDNGNPRVSDSRSRTATTRFPVSDVSTSRTRHSRLQSSTITRQRSRRPSHSPSEMKSIDQLRFTVDGFGNGFRSKSPIRLRFRRRTASPASR